MRKKYIYCIIACMSFMFVSPTNALEIKAFGDVTFGSSSKDEEPSSFTIGQLDLWGTQVIDQDKKMKVFMELVVEAAEGYVIDLERLWVEYSLTNNLRVRGGRFHTSLGYWNRTHHHGSHMQTTVFRPLFLDFEDGGVAVLPTHIIGIMGIANYETGFGQFLLELQGGNGTYFDGAELNPGLTGDIDDGKGFASRFVFLPEAIDGLGIGISYYINSMKYPKILVDSAGVTVIDSDENAEMVMSDFVDQSILGFDLSYIENNFEIIIEFYSMTNKDKDNTTEESRTSSFWYAQAGYTLFDIVTPYIRNESFDDIDAQDPFFTKLAKPTYTQIVYGARYDLDINSSIKIEGRSLNEKVLGKSNTENSSSSYWLQWTFAF